MGKAEKYIMYIVPIVGIGVLLYLASRQQQTQTVQPEGVTQMEGQYTQPVDQWAAHQPPAMAGQEQQPEDGMVEAEVAESEPVVVTQTYTIQQEQDCAYIWLTQSCPTYQEKNCFNVRLDSHMMTGDGTHYFRYTANYFKEGAWGVPIPSTMTFTVIIKNCQVLSHTYRET